MHVHSPVSLLAQRPDPKVEIDQSVDCFNSIVMLLSHELRGRRMAGAMATPFANELKVTHSEEGFSLSRAALPPGMTITFDAPHVEEPLSNHCVFLNLILTSQ
jgi:hypothetical protein